MSRDTEGDDDAPASEYTLVREEVRDDLDPELQEVILSLREERPLEKYLRADLTDDDADLVDVIAELGGADDEVPDGLNVVQRMGRIVTGTVEARRLAEVRSRVVSLKGARRLRETLRRS